MYTIEARERMEKLLQERGLVEDPTDEMLDLGVQHTLWQRLTGLQRKVRVYRHETALQLRSVVFSSHPNPRKADRIVVMIGSTAERLVLNKDGSCELRDYMGRLRRGSVPPEKIDDTVVFLYG